MIRASAGALQGLHLHLEPTSGIAGDMTVAALVDAGVPAKVVTDAVGAMGVRGLRARFERRRRGGFVGRGFVVSWPGRGRHHDGHDHDHGHGAHEHEHEHEHRDYAEVKRLLARARLDADARALAGDIFARIAHVEAALHGTRVDRVAFHEVGAYDSIADVVGAAAAIAWLAPASIGSLPPVVGTGRVRTAHGTLGVPAPATAALLRGVPIVGEGRGELTTPTGAAIVAAVVDDFGPPPPLALAAIGYGAGPRELDDRPNVLRVLVGAPLGRAAAPAAPEVVRVEANLDDMSPELIGPLVEALLEAGAVDAWSAPIVMKKGRPALEVTALAPPGALAAVERAFFLNSTTLGVRTQPMARAVLARAFERVATPWGPVRVKLGALEGQLLGAKPELEDCRRLATKARVPVRAVHAAATAAAQALVAGRAPRARPRARARSRGTGAGR
ncbi:MAG TPA: nickel pincer cofactor biosynthesis protein LarC [Polyangia bacterium]|nr:nickel pincer cofactor biosynthesis protein LarC [Polyangia bacterium]